MIWPFQVHLEQQLFNPAFNRFAIIVCEYNLQWLMQKKELKCSFFFVNKSKTLSLNDLIFPSPLWTLSVRPLSVSGRHLLREWCGICRNDTNAEVRMVLCLSANDKECAAACREADSAAQSFTLSSFLLLNTDLWDSGATRCRGGCCLNQEEH